MSKTPPAVPIRTDAEVTCGCGGVARITAVAPIVDQSDRMRHTYRCEGCAKDLTFEVMKKEVG